MGAIETETVCQWIAGPPCKKLRLEVTSFPQNITPIPPPIDRLPTELLLAIFSNLFPAIWRNVTPIRLSLVCSRWRTIVLSSPEFWSSIFIGRWCDTEIIGAYLAHSGNRALDIAMHVPSEETFMNECFQEPIELCVEHAARWRSLDVTIPFSGFLSMTRQGKLDLPLLESLNIGSCWSVNDLSDMDEASRLIRRAPKLRHVRFRGSVHENYSSPSALPWKQLTSVSYSNCHSPLISDHLAYLSNVENITIQAPMCHHAQLGDNVTSPLRVLSLRYIDNARFVSGILDTAKLSLPNLTELNIAHCTKTLPSVVSPFIRGLTRLTLVDNTAFDDIAVIALLESTPHLEEFVLRESKGHSISCVTAKLLAFMSKTSAVRKLKYIEMTMNPPVPEDLLLGMLQCRTSLEALASVKIGLVKGSFTEETKKSLGAYFHGFAVEGPLLGQVFSLK
ncbi:hypothetical protein ARMSODRAFT_1003804 [Armillaria solidipes]|uniref:F-box domain-containing protein n=1 Tax=Armillaria solidipes TaxID=1076256 RepID=A0A2H3BHA5_9AGAR|nr:hypothetical protein ARMSODRAFT_1003804 [Armillaria solidipes]